MARIICIRSASVNGALSERRSVLACSVSTDFEKVSLLQDCLLYQHFITNTLSSFYPRINIHLAMTHSGSVYL